MTYRFALVNLSKRESLFGRGMQPVVYSEQDAARKGVGWCHRGTNVHYAEDVSSGDNNLSFHYEFEHAGDRVYRYFAYSQPYSCMGRTMPDH